MTRWLASLCTLLLIPTGAALTGCSDDGGGSGDEGTESDSGTGTGGEQLRYEATIRRTSHGVPHIWADDWGSLGFGQGYAFTEDKGCILADQIIKVRSERARWFGPGDQATHIHSDLGWLHLGVIATAERELPNLPENLVDMIEGYAAGFNQAVSEGKIGGTCDDAEWLPRDVTGVDLFAYYLNLAMLGGSWQALEAIGSAQPPGSGDARGEAPPLASLNRHRGVLGSNGWAIGSDITANGGGMVFGNPHFPWEGELQLWESHLILPSEDFEVYGVGLLGVPGVLIGFNEDVAWTHTFSDGQRLTLYEIRSPPGEPTRYLYDDEVRDMESSTYTIEVLNDDGSLREETHTLWRTHYGPMLNLAPFFWTEALALSLRDANIENYVLIEQFLGMNAASSLDEFIAVHDEVNGIPWVNTMAASADGRTWYMDSTPTANLSDEAIAAWEERREGGFTSAFFEQDLVLLEGFTSRDEWQDDPGARSPGLIAPANLPRLERSDFVFNANDSHWLSNPLEPLTGFSPLHGFEETGRSVRTRMNAQVLLDMAAGEGFTGEDGKLDLDEMIEASLSNQGMTEQLLRNEVVARCDGVGVWEVDGAMVDVAEACDLLAAWDGLLELDSVGAVIWREWTGDYDARWLREAGDLFAEDFDISDPIATPRGLAPAGDTGDRALDALARAVQRLDQAGVALDSPLGEVQFARQGGEDIPITGGYRAEGVTNLMIYDQFRSTLDPSVSRGPVVYEPTDLTTEGYLVNYGASFLMAVELGEDGPRGQALLTYGQSAEPDTGWVTDQTRLFSAKQWRDILWDEADILADPELNEYEVQGGESTADE